MRPSLIIGALVALITCTPSRAASKESSPEQLIRKLYADQTRSPGGRDPLWWSHLSRRTKLADNRLKTLQFKTGDYVIDYDWLCQCQDSVGLRIIRLLIANTSPRTATATVTFRITRNTNTVKIYLVNEGNWKIDDIEYDGARFTATVREGIASFR